MNSRKIATLSRDKYFLIKACVFLVGLAAMISFAIWAIQSTPLGSRITPSKSIDTNPIDAVINNMGIEIGADLDAKTLAGFIRNRKLASYMIPKDYTEIIVHESESQQTSPDYQTIHRRVQSSTAINEGERERLNLLLTAIHKTGQPRKTAVEQLLSIDSKKQYRNEFLGDAYLAIGEPELALEAYTLEGTQFPDDSSYSQRSAVIAYTKRKEAKPLGQLLAKPEFRKHLDPSEKTDAALAARKFGYLFLAVVEREVPHRLHSGTLLCLAGCLVWFFILALLDGFSRQALIWGTVAFLLGIFSTVLTLYCLYIQVDLLNFVHNKNDTLLDQLIYNIAGIGLREETTKLLCFIPVAIIILRYNRPSLALVTAAMTGLGFAMFENVGYMNREGVFNISDRLLSANSLHLCLTGLVGYSLYQCLARKGKGWENFLFDFLFVVFIHGIYDALILIPVLEQLSIATVIIIVLIGYRYFDLLKSHVNYSGVYNRISPLGVLVVGTAAFASLILIVGTIFYGLEKAAESFLQTTLFSLPLAFAFISRFRDV